MKKFILSMIALLIAFSMTAQEQNHLTFKGIPIAGTIDEFAKKMQNAGFRETNDLDGAKVFKGEFLGEKDVKVFVMLTPKTRTVHCVAVIIPDMEYKYDDIVSRFTIKYGEPHTSTKTLTLYDLKNGIIDIALVSKEIHIMYTDSEGMKIDKSEKNSIIDNDI